MLILFCTIILHFLVAYFCTEICEYFPSISIDRIDSNFFNNEIIKKFLMCLMILLPDDLILIPPVDELVANLQLDELLVKLLQCRLIVLYS